MNVRTRILSVLALSLFAAIAGAQEPASAPAATPPAVSTPGTLAKILSPDNIAPAAFILSNVADAKTDWHFNLGGRAYTVTPAQRLSIAGGSIFTALAIRHFYPKTAKPLNIALTVATCYFAGRAYANTFNHGTPAGTPAARIAFAVQLH
jgi:hypothetical protein